MAITRDEYYEYIKKNVTLKVLCDKFGILTKQVGNDYVCSCIYHNDPNPSMHIYTESQSFYCFECETAGNIFSLIKHQLNCSFYECIQWLEKEYPNILREKPSGNIETGKFYQRTGYQIAYETYKKMTSEEEQQLVLFAKKREYSADFFKEHDIFFMKGRKLLQKYGKASDKFVEETELLKECELLQLLPYQAGWNSVIHYDDYFIKDCVVITIRNANGTIVGFAARSIDDTSKPKYLFSKNLKKGNLLYRFDEVRRHLGKGSNNRIWITEGYFDALRLETMGEQAVAVLGSMLTRQQIKILEEEIGEKNIFIRLFLDKDAAGEKGTVACITRIWKSKILRRCYLDVAVVEGNFKDLDEVGSGANESSYKIYSGFEFLMRYYMKNSDQTISKVEFEKDFESMRIEERLSLLQKIKEILPYQSWEDVFLLYDNLMSQKKGTLEKDEATLIYFKIKYFILNSPKKYNEKQNKSLMEERQEINYSYQMQIALQIARTSYEREEVSLDCGTWERIGLAADAFFPYLYEKLEKNEKIRIPMFTVKVPKKLGITRTKSLYCHEELLIQQYILNELLSSGLDANYEKNIPAVRYRNGVKLYTTGFQYPDLAEETVSFAYQIDMDVLNGGTEITHGMFRPFYDCWKTYINYVRDGIEKLESTTVYRVKLDIQGFYDNIYKHVVRNALYKSVEEALHYRETKFECFQEENQENYGLPKKVVSWILDELFKTEYYDSKNGELCEKGDSDRGIPQGPNLSSYAANVVLFSLDQKVMETIRQYNKDCGENKIRVRYARYVDDMIIIASSPAILLRIKEIIATELFDLGLSLSSKTEAEDGISKDEAFDWTTEERGGFGVSAGFDLADDTYEDLLDEYEEYEKTDRKGALKLLQSGLYALLYESDSESPDDKGQLLATFFKTEEIRYGDIVRFSELLLYYAAKESNLLEAFKKMWKSGIVSSPEESLFLEEDLDKMILIDGCVRILQRGKKGRKIESREKWRDVEKKICEELTEICNYVRDTKSDVSILNSNCWVIEQKLIELYGLADDSYNSCIEGMTPNEYSNRWKWSAESKHNKLTSNGLASDDLNQGKEQLLQQFHFCIESFKKMGQESQYEDLKSEFKNYEAQYQKGSDDTLLNCICIWFFDAKNFKNSDYEIAVRVLLNTVPENLRAAIIAQNEKLKEYLFDNSSKLDFLPVYPGVSYPGIMAVEKSEDKKISKIERIDFAKGKNDIILSYDNWTKFPQAGITCDYFEKDLANAGYSNLKDFCTRKPQSAEECMKLVCTVYEPLQEKISEIYKEAEKKEKRVILSAQNVLLLKNEETISVDLTNTYLVSQKDMPDVVAMEEEMGDGGRYTLKNVYEDGKQYWVAGYLLSDACGIKNVIFKDESSEKAITKKNAIMLDYSMRRLYGHTFQNQREIIGKRRSYQMSTKRTIGLMKTYLDSDADGKDICLLDAKIVNSYIAEKMRHNIGEKVEISYRCAIWAKKSLRMQFRDLIQILDKRKVSGGAGCQMIRRVPRWYCMLADRIGQLLMIKSENFWGLHVLMAGLYADSVLMHLRMQALECIFSFDKEQRMIFAEHAEELPLKQLGLDKEDMLITEGEIGDVYRNLFTGDKYDKSITKLTHLGWLVLLAKVYEIDKQTGFIIFDSKDKERTKNELKESLRNIISCLKSEEEAKLEFPFEGMQPFFSVWKKENVEKIQKNLISMDENYGTLIEKKESPNYSQNVMRKKVSVQTNEERFEEYPYFLTYGKLSDGLCDVERSVENEEVRVYTQTRIRNKIVGFSTIDKSFGKLMQSWENEDLLKLDSEIEAEADNPVFLGKNEISQEETPLGEGEQTSDKIQQNSKKKDKAPQNFEQFLSEDKMDKRFAQIQANAWERRGKSVPFKNGDRIALFQFAIDSSYKHPEAERCTVKNFKEQGVENEIMYSSCAEYRRRKLLKPVFKACSLFNIDILILPEYSVRPETVYWMQKEIINEKYEFSVWAGTFRIPPQYTFDGNETIYAPEKNMSQFWHAASLPVIVNNKNGNVEILLDKFKKYPSVALKEDINPTPAYITKFISIMERYLEKDDDVIKMAEKLKDRYGNFMIGFGDARDDVTELICAELFAVASVSNSPSFVKASMEACSNYMRLYKDKKSNKGKIFEDYNLRLFKDMEEFGKITAIYRQDERKIRRSILLVPACTTRAVDYYVFGQGFYLSAGLKTVFCNAVGTGGRGGSCFVGPDSWDDHKISNNEYLKENTIYHGLKPGIFMQTSSEKGRGALGNNEQALLICDIYPNLDKGSPNSESMMNAFSLVAHIPIFEHKKYGQECNGKCYHKQHFPIDYDEKLKKDLECIQEFCKTYEDKPNAEKNFSMSLHVSDVDSKRITDSMKCLGEFYHSDWFIRRAEAFEKYRVLYPQRMLSPTLTDWMYVETDYEGFRNEYVEENKDCKIQIPKMKDTSLTDDFPERKEMDDA